MCEMVVCFERTEDLSRNEGLELKKRMQVTRVRRREERREKKGERRKEFLVTLGELE